MKRFVPFVESGEKTHQTLREIEAEIAPAAVVEEGSASDPTPFDMFIR